MPSPARPTTRAPGQPQPPQVAGIEPDRTSAPKGAAGRMVLRPDQRDHAFTYMVHPLRWEARAGHIVPQLLKISHEPGSNGNGRDSNGVGAVTNFSREGWIAVPDDFACTAHGQDRTGEPCTYRNRWTQRDPVSNAIQAEHHLDAWHRPRIVGSTVVWDFDAAGELAFRLSLGEWLAPTGPDATLIEEALLPLLDAIRSAATRTDGRRAIILNALALNLPREHAPPDVLALIEAANRPPQSAPAASA